MNDSELLTKYVRDGSQEAFTELVRRNTDMVYSSCLRRLGNAFMAEEATQAVFIALSRKARSIKSPGALTSWLFTAAKFASTKVLRSEVRRKKHEKEAGKMRSVEPEKRRSWEEVAPFLDDALLQLGSGARYAVVQRFFGSKSHAEVGEGLGISEEAARKRISYALEKLRRIFSKKGVILSAAILGTLLGEKAVVAAPAGLAAASSSLAFGGATAGSAGLIAKGVVKMMMWAKIKLVAVCVAAAVVLGVGMPAAMKLAAQEKLMETGKTGEPKTEKKALVGFRGNWTGRFPRANPPIAWHKVSKVMAGLRCQAEKPEGDGPAGVPMHSGTISEWLILGPVPSEGLQDEGNWQPVAGEQIKGKTWEKFVTNGSEVNAPALFTTPNGNIVYLHSYVYSPREGAVRFKQNGGKAKLVGMYVNGTPVDPGKGKRSAFASSPGSKGHSINLRKGWNRFLCKLTAKSVKGKSLFQYPDRCAFDFGFRAAEPPRGSEMKDFEMKNILWATRLPHWSAASPVIVGNEIFVMAEPGDLICLDKESGRIKWIRPTTFYDVADEKERKENPAFKDIGELVKKLKQFNEELVKSGSLPQSRLKERGGIYKQIVDGMRKIDKDKYYAKFAHPGNTLPTPVSDGKHIYFRLQHGIAACFDLEGNRRWTSSASMEYKSEHGYCSSVALIGGNLLVPRGDLTAFDAVSGKLVWQIKGEKLRVIGSKRTPFGLNIGGKEYICYNGCIINPENGKILWDKWPTEGAPTTPVLADGALFNITGRGGRFFIRVELPGKLSDLSPSSKKLDLKPKTLRVQRVKIVTSPVIHEGLAYVTDIMAFLYVIDIKTCSLVYSKSLGMGPEWSTSVYDKGISFCSPVLAGKHIYFFGANGTTVVIEPGRTYKEVARNKIEDNGVDKDADKAYGTRRKQGPYTIESFVSTPVAEGERLYIRGDKYLYCIGETE